MYDCVYILYILYVIYVYAYMYIYMYMDIYIYIYIYQQGFPYWGIGDNLLTSQKFAHSKLLHPELFLPPPKVNFLPTK